MISFKAETKTVGILCASGELMQHNETDLKSAILEALMCVDNLFLDFEKVTAVDTSGLEIISMCYEIASRLGKHVTISRQSPEFLNTVRTAGYSFADIEQECKGSQP